MSETTMVIVNSRDGDMILNVRTGQKFIVSRQDYVGGFTTQLTLMAPRRTFWQWLTRKPRPSVDIRDGDPLELVGHCVQEE